ncbi:MAG: YafY family protein [Rhodoferax sp.]|nr:YafY family protein [Rhodoferax sp.]
MKKVDRLFRVVQLLQGRRTALPARTIATEMRVSLRTVYRDINDLVRSGTQIDGEAGVGYVLHKQAHVPPLMFTAEEVLALLVGSRMVQATTDPDLGLAARGAEQKIRAVLTDSLQLRADLQPYRIPQLERDADLRALHGVIRQACEAQAKLRLHYLDEQQQASERTIWPLSLVGMQGVWLLLGWCELRCDYRNFRFDRIQSAVALPVTFQTTPTINIAHYFTKVLGIDDSAWR